MKAARYRVKPGSDVRLKKWDPGEHHFFRNKEETLSETRALLERLDPLQEKLYAGRRRSLLVILQGIDTAGKDGTIRHVMSGVNPAGCHVASFKTPTPEEASHDFLWRVHRHAPAKGMIAIFNRSHYEDVIITRVHHWVSDKDVQRRFEVIREFEKSLAEGGTAIVKFFLHISKDEQKKRLEARLEDPGKRWKFSLSDVAERRFWKFYRRAYEWSLGTTSTEYAPWYIVPSNHKWYRDWVVANVLVKTLENMRLKAPAPDPKINFDKIRII
jgi:PPK2 family polyphosphate:nucleotide phosphotransferase